MKAALSDWEDREVGRYVNIRDHPFKEGNGDADSCRAILLQTELVM